MSWQTAKQSVCSLHINLYKCRALCIKRLFAKLHQFATVLNDRVPKDTSFWHLWQLTPEPNNTCNVILLWNGQMWPNKTCAKKTPVQDRNRCQKLTYSCSSVCQLTLLVKDFCSKLHLFKMNCFTRNSWHSSESCQLKLKPVALISPVSFRSTGVNWHWRMLEVSIRSDNLMYSFLHSTWYFMSHLADDFGTGMYHLA